MENFDAIVVAVVGGVGATVVSGMVTTVLGENQIVALGVGVLVMVGVYAVVRPSPGDTGSDSEPLVEYEFRPQSDSSSNFVYCSEKAKVDPDDPNTKDLWWAKVTFDFWVRRETTLANIDLRYIDYVGYAGRPGIEIDGEEIPINPNDRMEKSYKLDANDSVTIEAWREFWAQIGKFEQDGRVELTIEASSAEWDGVKETTVMGKIEFDGTLDVLEMTDDIDQ